MEELRKTQDFENPNKPVIDTVSKLIVDQDKDRKQKPTFDRLYSQGKHKLRSFRESSIPKSIP